MMVRSSFSKQFWFYHIKYFETIPDAGYSMLDAAYSMLDARYSMLDT